MTLSSEQRQYYRRTAGRFCACGDPAALARCGDFICAGCAAKETLAAGNERRRATTGTPDKSYSLAWQHDPDDPRHYTFRPFLRDLGDALLVGGHGEYRLRV